MQAFLNIAPPQVTKVTTVGRALVHGSTEYSGACPSGSPESRARFTSGATRGP